MRSLSSNRPTSLLATLLLVVTVASAFVHKPASTSSATTSTTTTELFAIKEPFFAIPRKGTAIIAGASGYIGRSVVRESVRQGYETYALVRDAKKASAFTDQLAGAKIVECDVCEPTALTQTFQQIKEKCSSGQVDAVVSCLASRSGVKKDSFKIDYQATLNCLESGIEVDAGHFVLLSAFCVKNPILQFQKAKLKFEAALQEQDKMSWTIVRPTAFFKSVSGQLEVVQGGAPFVMFGDGEVTRCNPIAESDLAMYLMDSVTEPSRRNQVINLGGPDEPLTQKRQGEMIFQATDLEPKFVSAPLWLFDVIIDGLQWLADLTGSEDLEDAAETGRIGKYYAVEDMLTTDPKEKFGSVTLQEHYNRIAVEGQEYDPYTSFFAKAKGASTILMEEVPVS